MEENVMNKEDIKFFLDYDDEVESLAVRIKEYLDNYGTYENEELIIGNWIEAWDDSNDEANKIVSFLVDNKEKFTNLKSIYFGDMDFEECEISWIINGDLAPLINNFNIEKFTAKGGTGLSFKNMKSETLKELIVISGGTSKDTIEEIIEGELPNLEKLELYFGDSNYGFDANIEDIIPFTKRENFPKLKYLGLKNSEIQDEICEKVFEGDIIEELEVLDLSLGTLTDKGAKIILDNIGKVSHLKKLDLTYNYIKEDMLKVLEERLGELDIEYSLSQEDVYFDDDDEYRSPFITE
ncbi:MAG: STM4015 family protein [Clostridium argentinense]|nr:STM4015 family protein [Clostridium argentinense]